MWILPKNLPNSPISPSVPDTEELTSDLNELACLSEQSLMWRSKPSSAKTWLRRWKKGGLMSLLSGRILKPSIGDSLMEKWISSVEASLVSHLVKQEEGMEVKTQDTCGRTSLKESNSWEDLPLFSLKTLKESSAQSSKETHGLTQKEQVFCTMSSKSWKDWVTKQRQAYSQRVKSVRPINENESLYLVSIQDSTSKEETLLLQNSLEDSDLSWGTPRSTMSTYGETEVLTKEGKFKKEWQFRLENQVCEMKDGLLTPQQEELVNTRGNLQEQSWATPASRDWKGKYPKHSQEKKLRSFLPDQAHIGSYVGRLNPRWVETLMGVPVGWTSPNCTHVLTIEQMNLECLETELYLQHAQEQSESCGANWGTPTTSQLQLNESLGAYLRRSKKRIDTGKSVFPTQLTFEVEAEESGVDIKKELEEHKKVVNK